MPFESLFLKNSGGFFGLHGCNQEKGWWGGGGDVRYSTPQKQGARGGERGGGGGGGGDQTTHLPFCSTSISGIGKESKRRVQKGRERLSRVN